MHAELEEDYRRMCACPPHLRMKLVRQSLITTEFNRAPHERTGLLEQLEAIAQRMGAPDPTLPTGKPIDFKWHRRRWLP